MNTRIERVLEQMRGRGLSQLLLCDPQSIFYLTGVEVVPFERLFAFLLRADGRHTLFLNRLFNVRDSGFAEVWFSDTDDAIGLLAGAMDAGILGVDKLFPAGFLLPLLARKPDLRPVLASDCVDDCRAVKDEQEQALMRRASQINDEVIALAAAHIKEGMTEREVAAFIDAAYLAHGASGNSFDTIVCFGKNAADPHHEPDDTVLRAGDGVLLDMGCVYRRYCSDMTRTFVCGEPDAEFVAVHDLVRRANEAAEAIIRPGVLLCEIDRAAREMIERAGYGPYFNHRLGHFIGQAEHEKGDVSSASRVPVHPGMIFSIEPGVYLPGRFGVRIEDLVLVTETGCEVLNRVPKELRAVGQP